MISVLTRRIVCDLWLLFAKRAPPANFGSPLRTNGMDYRNIPWVCSLHGFIDHVYRFLSGSFHPKKRVLARNGYVLRVCDAPYWPKWKCFWGSVEYATCDMWLKFSVDPTFCLWFFGYCLRNGPHPLTLEARYERTVWTIKISLEYVYRMGS